MCDEAPSDLPRESSVRKRPKDEVIDLEGMDDPFGKRWEDVEEEYWRESPYYGFKSYELWKYIFKSNDDLRQELLAVQLIKRLDSIFKAANLSLWLYPYEIMITSNNSGYLEVIPNTISIDGLKKSFP